MLIGKSPEMEVVRRFIRKAAWHSLPVLLLGESGTGKEVVARAIHEASPRGRLTPIDCGSLVGTLMESELFGHVKGAFSGAIESKKALVELADGGTAFFDEIGDLPLDMQVKLLRLIQEKEFRPVGSLQWKKVDLRIIAATHRDLKAEVAAGRFRLDLYYRLNVMSVKLPPLRERRRDIPELVEYFLASARHSGLPALRPSEAAMSALIAYDWPGNVRELKNAIERMSAMASEDGAETMLPTPIAYRRAAALSAAAPTLTDDAPLRGEYRPPAAPVISLPESEREAIQRALAATHGERRSAASALGIGRTTLYRKMKQYGLD